MNQQSFWDDVPDRTSLDAGTYRMKIVSIKELEKDERNSYKTLLATFEVEEPKEFEGETHFERFRIGDENDPLAKDKATWKRSLGAKNAKKLLKAANAPFLDSDEAIFQACKGNSFVAKIVKVAGKVGSQNEGQEFSNIRGYFSITSPEAQQVGMTETPAYMNGGVQNQASQQMTCGTCGEKIPRAEFGKHIADHKNTQEAAK